MPVINPHVHREPIPAVHTVVRDYEASLWKYLGPPIAPVQPVKLRGEIRWVAVWFIDGRNNNLSVTYTSAGSLAVEFHSDKDPRRVTFDVRTPELLAEYLTRFTPDHWKANA